MILRRLTILTPTVRIPSGYISIDEDRGILDVDPEPYGGPPGAYEDMSDFVAVPGFVDTHVHGFKGLDIASEPYPETVLGDFEKALAAYGVTLFTPTSMSAPADALLRVCKAVRATKALWSRDSGARVLGLHLEGPFISVERAGAHAVEYVRRPSASELDSYVEASGSSVI